MRKYLNSKLEVKKTFFSWLGRDLCFEVYLSKCVRRKLNFLENEKKNSSEEIFSFARCSLGVERWTVGWDNFKTFVCMLLLREITSVFTSKNNFLRHPIVILDTPLSSEKIHNFLLNSERAYYNTNIAMASWACGALESPESTRHHRRPTTTRWHEKKSKRKETESLMPDTKEVSGDKENKFCKNAVLTVHQ